MIEGNRTFPALARRNARILRKKSEKRSNVYVETMAWSAIDEGQDNADRMLIARMRDKNQDGSYFG